jgi:hypothetical protein
MSDVQVSVKLTQKQAGALYMKSMRQADRIKEMKDGLREIVAIAEAERGPDKELAWRIATKAKALLEARAQQSEGGQS